MHTCFWVVKFLHNFRISESSNLRNKIIEESCRSSLQLIWKEIIFLFHTITKGNPKCVAGVDSTVTDYLKNTKEGDILKLMLALFKVLYIIDALASLFPFNGQENPNSES